MSADHHNLGFDSVSSVCTSRRDAIRFGLAALAGVGVSALAPREAWATTGAMQYGAFNDAGAAHTTLVSTAMDGVSSGWTLGVVNSASEANRWALKATNDSESCQSPVIRADNAGAGAAVYGQVHSADNSVAALHGVNEGANGLGVLGESASEWPNARGVKGVLLHPSAEGCAVEGTVVDDAPATGVWGNVAKGTGYGVKATNAGTGGASLAEITNASSNATALTATTPGGGLAVYARQEGGDGSALLAEVAQSDNVQAAVRASTLGGGSALEAVAWSLQNASPAVIARTEGIGAALHAEVSTSANAMPAVSAKTVGQGCAIQAEGGRAQLYVVPAPQIGPPLGGSHQVGEHFTDAAGRDYVCRSAGVPGKWESVLVTGANTGAVSVQSTALTAPAIRARASAANGTALRVEGALSMNRSGRAKISKGAASVTVTVSGGLATSANIICTPQNYGGSGVYVRYAKRVSPTQFRIALNKEAGATLYVAWMVLG